MRHFNESSKPVRQLKAMRWFGDDSRRCGDNGRIAERMKSTVPFASLYRVETEKSIVLQRMSGDKL
jgi:hypothetical protein